MSAEILWLVLKQTVLKAYYSFPVRPSGLSVGCLNSFAQMSKFY